MQTYTIVLYSSSTYWRSIFPPQRWSTSQLHAFRNMSYGYYCRMILWPFYKVCKACMNASRPIPTFCNKSAIAKSSFAISIDDRTYYTFCNTSLTYLIMSSALSSSEGWCEITVLDVGGFGNPKWHYLFLQQ